MSYESEAAERKDIAEIDWCDGWGSKRHIRNPEDWRLGLCGACATNSPHPKRPPCKLCLKIAGLRGPVDAKDVALAAARAELEAVRAERDELARRLASMEAQS